MPVKVPIEAKRKYLALRKAQLSQAEALEKLAELGMGISRSTAARLEKNAGHRTRSQILQHEEVEADSPEPKVYEELSPEGARGVDDFMYFCREFIKINGKAVETPGYWGESAAELDRLSKLGAETEEFLNVLMTFHPGAGKTTMVQLYIFWRILRARALGDFAFSVMFGSLTLTLAKRILRVITWNADHNEHLVNTFGRIRPIAEDGETTWTKTEIMVAGMGGGSKDATLTVWGVGQAIVGVRPNLAVWDDMVDKSNVSPANTKVLQQWWDSEAARRVEPGGVTVATGHFMSPTDLYHVFRDRKFVEEDGSETKMWTHYKFKAHDASRCPVELGTGHEHTEYPAGCLLWPKRWSYRYFMVMQQTDSSLYAMMFQSEDGAMGDILVPQIWVDGGIDENQNLYPGCLDSGNDPSFPSRQLWSDTFSEADWVPGLFTIATLDPSPTKWAVYTVTTYADSEELGPTHNVVGYHRARMTTEEYPPLIEKLTLAIRERDPSFDTWVVEKTGAEYLHGAEAMKTLPRRLKIQIVAHETRGNKSHEEYGIWAHRNEWKYGRVRLPWGGPATQAKMKQFIAEHTVYPWGDTDDCVLSFWFYFLHRPNVAIVAAKKVAGMIRRWTPGWLPKPQGTRAQQAGAVGSGVKVAS